MGERNDLCHPLADVIPIYAAVHVPFCGVAVMETLLETRTAAEDPWNAIIQGWTGHKEYPWQKPIVEELAAGALPALEAAIKREKLL